MLSLPSFVSFGSAGRIHQVGLDQIAGDTNGDCFINAEEAGTAGTDYMFQGRVIGPNAPFHFNGSVHILLGGLSIGSSSEFAIANNVASFSIQVPLVQLAEGVHTLLMRISRPGFANIDLYNFGLTVDTVPPNPVDVLDVADPRNNAVESVLIDLSEVVRPESFTREDLSLMRDGQAVPLGAEVTVFEETPTRYRVSGLTAATDPQGSYNLSMFGSGLVDLAGNAGNGMATASWFTDKTPPDIDSPPLLDPLDDTGRFDNDSVTRQQSDLTFRGSANGASAVDVQITAGGTLIAQRIATLAGNDYFAEFAGPIPEGDYEVTAIAIDTAGNTVTSPPREIAIDVTAPPMPGPPDLTTDSPGPLGTDIDDITNVRSPAFQVSMAETDAAVELRRNLVLVASASPAVGGAVAAIQDQMQIANDTAQFTFAYTLSQIDLAGNRSAESMPLSVVVDPRSPEIVNPGLAAADRLASVLPNPITLQPRPTIEFRLREQQFAAKNNPVRIRITESDGTVLEERTVTIAAGTDQTVTRNQTFVYDFGPGEHTISFAAFDAAGNAISPRPTSFTFYVALPGADTPGAPGTPVFGSSFFLGGTVAATASQGATQILVDRAVPVGITIRLGGQSLLVQANEPIGEQFRLTVNRALTRNAAAGSKFSWLRPWTMAYDNTTQTTWFTCEDGHRLGQFDPATGLVRIYDVQLPTGEGPPALDPHGVAFDFETHFTPRVWFVYRNENTDGDTPSASSELARLGYFDLNTNELLTSDFAEVHELLGLHPEGAHNISVDVRGRVWVSLDHSNLLFEIDFSTTADGRATGSASSRVGRVIVHELPPALGDRTNPDQAFTVHPHGIQVVVDERTGEAYVWLTDGNVDSTGRVFLLKPGAPGGSDTWYEWIFDEALLQEQRLDAGAALASRPHPLFVALDDRETPGIPEDDLVVFGDPGGLRMGGSAGVIRVLDPREVVREFVLGREAMPGQASSLFSVQVPKQPGARDDDFASTQQVFLDKQGAVYFIDALGGVGRIAMQDLDASNPYAPISQIQAPLRRHVSSPVRVAPIQMTSASSPLIPTEFAVAAEPMDDVTNTSDLSLVGGIDQYEVAQPLLRGQGAGQGMGGGGGGGGGGGQTSTETRGEGVFRAALTGSNVLIGSIAQSDHLSTTVFAESARRGMAVVPSPNPSLPIGVLRGRAAFQVLRDGSLLMTARGDGSTLDRQINLSVLVSQSEQASFPSLRLISDVSATLDAGGNLFVLGLGSNGTFVVFQFQPNSLAWTDEDLKSAEHWHVHIVAAQLPAESGFPVSVPTAFVDRAGAAHALATTNTGHLLHVSLSHARPPRDLSRPESPRVYSSVGVVEQAGRTFVYGTNHRGQLVEFSFNSADPTDLQDSLIVPPVVGRDVMVFQDVTAVEYAGARHVFATDGTARLVHFRITGIDATNRTVEARNVSQDIADTFTDGIEDNQRAFGYFRFQQPFVGRVLTNVEAITTADGLYVYGSTDRDLVEFKLSNDGLWRVANLSNDAYSFLHRLPGDRRPSRSPANEVLGAPAAYQLANGDRHIIQVNDDGEVIEYYFLAADSVQQIHTQNITIRLGNSNSLLQQSAAATVFVGADAGGGPHVRAFDRTTGGEFLSFYAYDPGFLGGVRVAAGDINGDGTPDLITAPGPGGGPHVRVFDGNTGLPLPGFIGSFFAYNAAFTGGLFVASADLNSDGRDDIVTGADRGGGPHVRVFNGRDGSLLAEFFAYGADFQGGVRVAVGNFIAGPGLEILTGAGPGGGPHLRVFEPIRGTVLYELFAFDAAFLGGVYVSGANLDGDGLTDLLAGAGAGGSSHVRAFAGADGGLLADFMAFDLAFGGGVRVGAADLDGDERDEILVVPGRGHPAHVTAINLAGAGVASFQAFPLFGEGMFVASPTRLAAALAGDALWLGKHNRAALRASSSALLAASDADSLELVRAAAFAQFELDRLSPFDFPALRESPLESIEPPINLMGLSLTERALIDWDIAK